MESWPDVVSVDALWDVFDDALCGTWEICVCVTASAINATTDDPLF